MVTDNYDKYNGRLWYDLIPAPSLLKNARLWQVPYIPGNGLPKSSTDKSISAEQQKVK